MKPIAAISALALLASCGGGGPDVSFGKGESERGGAGGDTSRLVLPKRTPKPVSQAPSRPRVIFTVMMDDADYHDFGYYSTDAVTPNMDAIARKGVTLSRFYSAAAICSPTRASVITGHEPAYFGLNRLWPDITPKAKGDYFQGKRGIPSSEETLPESLRTEGYRSLHIGKWHIGRSAARFLPDGQGFQDYEIMEGKSISGSMPVHTRQGVKRVEAAWRPTYQADRIISFIDQNLASGQNVFVNWWPIEPHAVPVGKDLFYVPPTFDPAAFAADAGKGKRKLDLETSRGKLIAQMHAFDHEFGRVVKHLKQKGLFDDSLIVVTSDNGGYKGAISPDRLVSGHKETLWEGGIRVPFAASWPKRFEPGTHSARPVVSTDLYPTIMGLIGGAKPKAVDGEDVSALLLGNQGARQPIYFQGRRAAWRKSMEDRISDSFALIDGCDKIIEDEGSQAYYDVCKDPGEDSDLSTRAPERFAQLQAALRARRLKASEYLSVPNLASARTLPDDDRLNVHHDDLSVYATVNGKDYAGGDTHTIYRRGEGVQFQISNGRLSVSVSGVATKGVTPAFRTATLNAMLPRDAQDHRIGLVIRGYLMGGATINLYIDDQLVEQVGPPLNGRLEVGQSIFAVKSEAVQAQLGDDRLPLRDVRVYINAIEPDELDGPLPGLAALSVPAEKRPWLPGLVAGMAALPLYSRLRRRASARMSGTSRNGRG